MPRRLKPNVKFILEQRYQAKLLNEALDDGGEGAYSSRALSKAKGKKIDFLDTIEKTREFAGQALQDVSDASGYTDFAYKYMPGVAGMAQVEVPYAKDHPKEYETMRSDLAKNMVLARKAAGDKGEKLDETEILKRAIAAKPSLAHVLTRDEYSSLAGDITNPLKLTITHTDQDGKETQESLDLPQWSGISNSSAILYDFLQGANESLTTPEGLATGAALGAGFKAAGAAVPALAKAVAPKLLKVAPEVAAKWGAKAVTGSGLALLGLGGVQAAEQGKGAKYWGSAAGGIPAFAAGSKVGEAGIAAGRQLGGAAIEMGKAGAKAVVEPVKDIAGDVLDQQQRNWEALKAKWAEKKPVDLTEPGTNKNIRRYNVGTDNDIPLKASYDNPNTGNRHWDTGLGYEMIEDAEGNFIGTKDIPASATEIASRPYSSPSATEAPVTGAKGKAAIAATAAGILAGAASSGGLTNAEVMAKLALPREAAVSVMGPDVGEVSGVSAKPETMKVSGTGEGSAKPVESPAKAPAEAPSKAPTEAPTKVPATRGTAAKVSAGETKQSVKQADAAKAPSKVSDSAKTTDSTKTVSSDTTNKAKATDTLPAEQSRIPERGGKGGEGEGGEPNYNEQPGGGRTGKSGIPGIPVSGGSNKSGDIDDERYNRMRGADIGAYLQGLFQTAQTIRVK